ncbi:hypothetical protein [Corynebacterium sp. 335C]
MNSDLQSIGLGFDTWQDAIEAAIGSDDLSVFGEVRGGQLVRFEDPSGAQLLILGVEPFSTYAGFAGQSRLTGHVSPVNDVLALIDVVDDVPTSPTYEKPLTSLTCNLAQGPMIVDEPTLSFETVSLTALALSVRVFETAEDYEERMGRRPGRFYSTGAAPILHPGESSGQPDASAELSGVVRSSERRVNSLTGDEFWVVHLNAPVPMDVTLPGDVEPEPAPGTVVSGDFMMVGEVMAPAGCGGDGGGCGSGSCGCH